MIIWTLLIACSAKDAAGPITPAEGTWTVSDATVTEDSCGAADSQTTPGSYVLALTGDDSASIGFSLSPDEGDPVDCALVSPDFDCQPTTDSESGSAGGASYTVAFSWTTSGSFQSPTAADGAIDMLITCTDTDDAFCAAIESQNDVVFPCTMTTTMTLTAE